MQIRAMEVLISHFVAAIRGNKKSANVIMFSNVAPVATALPDFDLY
jgi:hypothetical protein